MPLEAYIPFVILAVIVILLALAQVKSKLRKYRLRSPFQVVQPRPRRKKRHTKPKKQGKQIVIRLPW